MADSAVVSLVGLPTPYAVTGGGAYCTGDTGRQIGMAHTDTAITYSLYLNGNLVSGPLAGTGAAINFGTFTQGGVYTAKAPNSVGCDTEQFTTLWNSAQEGGGGRCPCGAVCSSVNNKVDASGAGDLTSSCLREALTLSTPPPPNLAPLFFAVRLSYL